MKWSKRWLAAVWEVAGSSVSLLAVQPQPVHTLSRVPDQRDHTGRQAQRAHHCIQLCQHTWITHKCGKTSKQIALLIWSSKGFWAWLQTIIDTINSKGVKCGYILILHCVLLKFGAQSFLLFNNLKSTLTIMSPRVPPALTFLKKQLSLTNLPCWQSAFFKASSGLNLAF